MLGITAACRLTGRSRATHYRRLQPSREREPRKPQVQPSALTAEERAAVLELMNCDEYAELPPAQIWARELDAGRYHCSVSTMYRILREKGQSGERRRQATHPARTVPELVATGPSQVFTWDITKAAGPAKGIWYHAYVIIDIFSRYIVGHTVEAAESAERAEELIRETITRNGIVPETVHADRGTSMTSKKVSQLLIDLGVTRSHSRPKVSNDNPYSEATSGSTTAALPAQRRWPTTPSPQVCETSGCGKAWVTEASARSWPVAYTASTPTEMFGRPEDQIPSGHPIIRLRHPAAARRTVRDPAGGPPHHPVQGEPRNSPWKSAEVGGGGMGACDVR
ncbi:DDE-type integrase/transposase/recombinase [Streptomyces sp. NPDC005799]|uniref:DDE-type integrase/transposase/recombinase n=1 Tax=Streptomyces sp. NPDC005799 TaxID=3154678 RepID=UPI0033E5BF0B